MMIKKNKLQVCLITLGLCFVLTSGLAACQSGAETPPIVTANGPQAAQPGQQTQGDPQDIPATPTSAVEDTEPDPAAIEAAWQSSSHADSYVVDALGENNSCARCHAPVNWTPTMDDLAESCFACKFEIKEGPRYIAEIDWSNVSCTICHTVDKKKNIQPEVAWLEIPQLGEYAKVASTTELCLKCHTPVDIPGHGTVEVAGAHAGYECTKCHSAHATTASCDTAGCHVEAAAPVAGHDEDHQKISCVACHDAGKMEVGLDEEKGLWTTFVSRSTGSETERFSFSSHNTVLEARCDRCHFAQNPWGLSEQAAQP